MAIKLIVPVNGPITQLFGENPERYKQWGFYDAEGHQLDLVMDHRFEPGRPRPAPPTFPAMRQVAETLARDFDFVRVDLYDRPEGILVGELTHAPLAGLPIFDPPEWDRRLGDLWGAALGESQASPY